MISSQIKKPFIRIRNGVVKQCVLMIIYYTHLWLVRCVAYLSLLHSQLLLVLASLVLEPDAHDARRQPRHLHQLLLHQGVGPRVRRVARLQDVELQRELSVCL